MSSPGDSSQLDRNELIEKVVHAIYETSTMAVFFHTAIAERVGLGATDELTLLILRDKPLSAGEIAQYTGLTTASVTSLIDRLESKGLVQRLRDKDDRRRVLVELNKARFEELIQVFASVQGELDQLIDGYTDEQLATIADYLRRTVNRSREIITKLNQEQKKG